MKIDESFFLKRKNSARRILLQNCNLGCKQKYQQYFCKTYTCISSYKALQKSIIIKLCLKVTTYFHSFKAKRNVELIWFKNKGLYQNIVVRAILCILY